MDKMPKAAGSVEQEIQQKGGQEQQGSVDTVEKIETEEKQASTQEQATQVSVDESTAGIESLDKGQVEERILKIVAEKTGYPVDMLELDLDLEADLGIDTVKQAEMFSEIRAEFGIPRQDDMKLSDYPTLGHIVGFAMDKMPKMGVTKDVNGTQAQEQAPDSSSDNSKDPQEKQPHEQPSMDTQSVSFMLPKLSFRPDALHCKPTGARISGNVWIAGGRPEEVQAASEAILSKGGQPIRLSSEFPDDLTSEARGAAAQGAPSGIWVLGPADSPVDVAEPSNEKWQRGLDVRVRMAYRLARVLDEFREDGKKRFFVCATRMGGYLGLDGHPSDDPLAGLTTGFVKSLDREWDDVLCKVVDFSTDATAAEVANAMLEETIYDPDVVEVGRSSQGRFSAITQEVDPRQHEISSWVDRQDPVVLVLGGTGGIASRVAADLASSSGGVFYLAGRAQLPSENDDYVKLYRSDRQALKLELVKRLREEKGRVTPVQVERVIRDIERGVSALDAMELVRSTGAKAYHVRMDVTDENSVSSAVKDIVDRHGRLDAVIHAAGLDISQLVGKKRAEEFERVLSPKVDGLRWLLKAVDQAHTEIKTLVLFGSIAGRYGNPAQTDYAAANDMFSKSCSYLQAKRPGLRVLTLDYGPWSGVGMASRGSVPFVMDKAGIKTIEPEDGAKTVRLLLGGRLTGEVVVAGKSLGSLLDVERRNMVDMDQLQRRIQDSKEEFALLSKVVSWTPVDGLHICVEFDPAKDQYLQDHRIEGTPVVPGVMAIECFAEAIRLLRDEPAAIAADDFMFDAPLKLYKDTPRKADLFIRPELNADGKIIYMAKMETHRELVGGNVQHTVHYRARLELVRQQVPRVSISRGESSNKVSSDLIYRAFFHGPSFQVINQASSTDDGGMAGVLAPGKQEPKLDRRAKMLTHPMLTELAFQTAGLLEAKSNFKLGLPAAVKKLVLHPVELSNPHGISAFVRKEGTNGDSQYAARVVDSAGRVLVEFEGYRVSALPSNLPESLIQGLGVIKKA